MELEEQEHTAESHAAFMAAIAVADAADAADAAARAAARDADRARAVRAADELAITRAATAHTLPPPILLLKLSRCPVQLPHAATPCNGHVWASSGTV